MNPIPTGSSQSEKAATVLKPLPATQDIEPFSMFPSSCSISDFEGESPKFLELGVSGDNFPMSEPLPMLFESTPPKSYLPASPPVSERQFSTLDPPNLVGQQELAPALQPGLINQISSGYTTGDRGTGDIHGLSAKSSSVFRPGQQKGGHPILVADEPDQRQYGYATSTLPFMAPGPIPGTFSSPEAIHTVAPMTTSPGLLQYSDLLTIPTCPIIDTSRPTGEGPEKAPFRARGRSQRSQNMGKTALKRQPHLRGQSLTFPPVVSSDGRFDDLSATLPSPASPNTSFSSIIDPSPQRRLHRARARTATSIPRGFCPDCACQRVKVEETKMGKFVTLRVPVEELMHINH